MNGTKTRKRVAFRADPELVSTLDALAKVKCVSRNRLMTDVLEGRLEEPEWVRIVKGGMYEELTLHDMVTSLEIVRIEVSLLKWQVRRAGVLLNQILRPDRATGLEVERLFPEVGREMLMVLDRTEDLANQMGYELRTTR